MGDRKKILFNAVTSIIAQAVIIVFGLVIPRIVLVFYGSDVNGLTNTITQVFSYLALLEAGISVAARNSLFKPINEGDKNEISRVVSLAKKYCEKVTWFYVIAIFAIAFLAPLILKTDVDYYTVFAYIVFQGLTNAVSFYFIQKWNAILSAFGENYVINSISAICKSLCYAVYILLICLKINLALVQLGFFIMSLLQLLLFSLYMRKHYGWIDYHSSKEGDLLKDKNDYLVSEIAWTVFSSTDMIVLSIFVSTSAASVYSIYNMVFLALNNILNSVFTALVYKLGLAYQNGIEHYSSVHDSYISVFHGVMTAFMCVCFVLTNPFVALYTKGINDIVYVHQQFPLLFCLVQLISWCRYVPGSLIGISGRQKDAVLINILEAVLNVVLSLILVNFLGIIGVLIATVVVVPIKVGYCIYISDVKVMQRSICNTLRLIIPDFLVFGLTVAVFSFFPVSIDGFFQFVIWGLMLLPLFLILVFAVSLCANKNLRVIVFSFLKGGKR